MTRILKGPSKGGHRPSPASVEVVLTEDCVVTATAGKRSVQVGLPPDGTAENLRPTELILSGLGGCILTNVIIFCRERDIDWQDARLILSNVDQADPPRIAAVHVAIHLAHIPADAGAEMIRHVQANSRMYNTLSAQVAVNLALAA